MNNAGVDKKLNHKSIFSKIGDFFTFQYNRFSDAIHNKGSLFYYVLILIFVGIGFYGYALITQYWTTPFGGDYTQQQIPFFYNGYDDWWTFLKTGKFVMWDENTFLGADNVGANSFYYLFNPIFLITLLFPRSWIPQIMACESILKVVLAGVFMRLYLKYMGCKEWTARCFSIAYSVCGWVAFYFWFNTFADVATFLPLMLLGIEVCIKERRPYVLVVSVLLEAVINYFFLFSICLFGVCYALFRLFQTWKSRTNKQNFSALGMGVLAFSLGLGMSCFAIIPGFLTALKSPRVSSDNVLDTFINLLKNAIDFSAFKHYSKGGDLNYFNAFNALRQDMEDIKALFRKSIFNWDLAGNSGKEYRMYYPLISFLFPTMSCRYVSMVDINYEWNLGSSIYVYYPTVMFFIVSVFESIRKRKISHFIAIGLFLCILFTPFFYSLFFGFSAQYGRWQIIAVISIIIYAALNFDNRDKMPKWFFPVAMLITLLLIATAYSIIRTKIFTDSVSYKYDFSNDSVFIYVLIVSFLEGVLIYAFFNKKYLPKIISGMIAFEAVVMGTMTQFGQGIISYSKQTNGGLANVNQETKIFNELNKYDSSYYRVYSTRQYQGNENIQYREGYNGVATFHSLYNYYVNDFLKMSHILKTSNTWIGGYVEKRLNLDTFLGVKYYVTKDSDTTVYYNNNTSKYINPNIPLQYNQILEDKIPEGYRIYENSNYIELGFSFDKLFYKYFNDEDEFKENVYSHNFLNDSKSTMSLLAEESYLEGAILNNSDVKDIKEKYGDVFSYEATPMAPNHKQLAVDYSYYDLKQYFDPFKFKELSDCLASSSSELKQKIIVITPSEGEFLNRDLVNGDFFILDLNLQSSSVNYNATVYLFDKYDNVISRDNHTSPGFSNNYKHLRGFYGENIAKMVIVPNDRLNLNNSKPKLYSQTYSSYNSLIDELKLNPLENVKKDVNTYKFSTNFENNRFIVLQLPYEKGWTITAKQNNKSTKLKYYNAQGGFVGFVANKGICDYIISYKTIGFTPAVVISLTSFAIFGGVIAGGAVIEYKRKEKEIL